MGGWQIIGAWYFNTGNILVFGPMVATGDPHLDNPTPSKWFDTSKFSRLPSYTQRTNPGPIRMSRDPSIGKSRLLSGRPSRVTERYKIQAKMAAYNLTNRLNRADPNMDVNNSFSARRSDRETDRRQT